MRLNRRSPLIALLIFLLVVSGVWVFMRARTGASGTPRRLAGPAGAGEVESVTDPDLINVTVVPIAPGEGVEGPFEDHSTVPVSFDGDLRNLPQIGPTDRRPMIEPEAPNWEFRIRSGQAVAPDFVDPVLQTNAVTLAMPAASQSFKGLDFAGFGGGWPPDTNGDVGPNHYIQTVNTSVGIYNKTGTRLAAFTLNSFFAAAAAPCNNSNNGDPVVVYDQTVDRWIVTDFAWTNTLSGPYFECIAVSKTSDPVSGGWWLYTFRADDATHAWLNDYPKLGVWSDGI